MDFAGLDLNLLVAMDALFAEMSVSRAGERLHLSQSATSGALARLRDVFHDPLLVQVGRKLTLTPLAEGLVQPVRQFLLQAEAILHTNPEFDPATSNRKFRVMMSDYVETVVMTELLPRMEKLAPGVGVHLISNIEGLEELERGEIDLAITPTKYLSAEHPAEPLFDDEFTCVVWSGNKKVSRTISRDAFLNLGHVVVRFGRHQQIPTFDELFIEQFSHERKIEVVTTAFNLVPHLLIGTARIATLHRRLAAFYQRYLPLKLLDPPFKIPRLEESMQWHRSRDHDPGTIWLRSMIQRAMGTGASPRPVSALDERAKARHSPSSAGRTTR
jgi:LysR family nod box-dependent transcriptional activator